MRGWQACVRKKPGRKHDVYLPGQDFICDSLRAFRVDVYLGGVYVGIARGSNWQVSPIRGICISPNFIAVMHEHYMGGAEHRCR